MASYRGIDQAEIADSIEAASSFLRGLNIGPVCNQMAESLTSDGAADAIRHATSDDQLVAAVNQSGASSALIYLYEALEYHAYANTDGKGLEVYQNLAKWGGINGARDMALHDFDIEIDDHLAKLPQIDMTQPLPTAESPFDRYGLVLKGAPLLPDPNVTDPHEWEARVAKIQSTTDFYKTEALDKVMETLAPFREKGELQYVGTGVIGNPNRGEDFKLGISFSSTRAAAQAVANAFPDRFEVVNSKDEVIAPQTKSHVAAQESRRAAGDQQHAR